MSARCRRGLCTVNPAPITATLDGRHVGVQHRCTPSRYNRSSLAVVGARDTRAPPRLIGFFVFASDPLDLRSRCRLPLLCVLCASAFKLLLYSFYCDITALYSSRHASNLPRHLPTGPLGRPQRP